MAAMDDAAAAALGEPIELLQKELDRRKRTDGVDEAAAAMEELDLAAAALRNSTESLQQDGSPKEIGLRIGAANANSIAGKKKQQKLKKAIPKSGFDIFIIIETKLTKEDSVPTLKGFRDERKDRLYTKKKDHSKSKTTGFETTLNKSPGGGILIYIKDTVVYKVKSKGEYAESNVEFLHIEITSPFELHLVALYSPNKVLVDHLISLMSYFMDPLGGRNVMFIGDTNIDRRSKESKDSLGNAFFDVLSQKPYEVKQLIELPTHDKACIDHIFTNMEVPKSGVMANCIDGDHDGIYCLIADSTSYVDADRAQENRNIQGTANIRITNQVTNQNNDFSVQNLMEELFDICNSCILAIVCKFADEVFAPIIDDEHPYLRSYCCKDEGMYYISVDTVDGREQKIELLQQAIGKVHKHLDIDVQKSKKQCIIFTRNSQTKVFHALQKEMWYRDWGWDVVWQPRHVEFLDFVLEPSLTHAMKKSENSCLWNMLQEGELKSIELEESSYRYWSEGGRSITRLTV